MNTAEMNHIRQNCGNQSLEGRVYMMLEQEISDYIGTRYWLRKKYEDQAEKFGKAARNIREGGKTFTDSLHHLEITNYLERLDRIERTIMWLCITLRVEREWSQKLIEDLRLENSLEIEVD